MLKRIVIPAGLLLVLLVLGSVLAVTHLLPFERKTTQATATPPTVPVVAGTVAQHDVPIYLRGVGTVIAYNTVVVRSQIQGQLVSINFTEGQSVHTGDLLAQIDPRPYQAQIDQITATRDRDQAQLTNARRISIRYTQLGAKGWATPQLVETQTAQVAELQNAIKADEALIEAAKVQLSYTRLTSPIDGVVGIRQIDIGNIIHPTDPNGLVVVTQVRADLGDIHAARDGICRRFRSSSWRQGAAQRSRPTVRTTRSSSTKACSDFIDNEILQTTGSSGSRRIFRTRSTGSGRASSINVAAAARYSSRWA